MAARPSLVFARVVVVAAGALAVWYVRRPAPPSPGPVPAAAGSSVATVPAPPASRVTKISKDERTRIAERIARAQASRAAVAARQAPSAPAAAPAAPALPAETRERVEEVATHVRGAMRDVTPFLVECARHHREEIGPSTVAVKASMLLDGDPDVGTLITASELRDEGGDSLPAGFDDCVRDALQSLQLPPLAEGDRFKVSYSFAFPTLPGDGSAGSAR